MSFPGIVPFALQHCAQLPEVASKVVPLRVDFAGGWLDVPKFAQPGAYIVNCAIEPFKARYGGGVGGSARATILAGRDPFESEAEIAGWQDAAVITETGFCVWRSGPHPVLHEKRNPEFLRGKMALLWTGKPHDTAALTDRRRDYWLIEKASHETNPSIYDEMACLRTGVSLSYNAQLDEGMDPLPFPKMPRKYLGSGWGGYALYLFEDEEERTAWLEVAGAEWEVLPIEPYMRSYHFGNDP